MSNAEAVREFTEGASGQNCPDHPQPMNPTQAMFIIRMIMSELDELACTVCQDAEDREYFMKAALESRDKCKKFQTEYDTDVKLVAAQFDALVDAWYYGLNTAAKHGVNMSSIFDLVHQANMYKRDPETGKFLKREDGKIIKPKGWKSPDIEAEIQRQMNEGAWQR